MRNVDFFKHVIICWIFNRCHFITVILIQITCAINYYENCQEQFFSKLVIVAR